jgi:hypothetical protein
MSLRTLLSICALTAVFNIGFGQEINLDNSKNLETLRTKISTDKAIFSLAGAELSLKPSMEKYLKGYKKAFRCSYYTLNNLSKAANTIQTEKAFDCLDSNIAYFEANDNVLLEKAIQIELQTSHDLSKYSHSL